MEKKLNDLYYFFSAKERIFIAIIFLLLVFSRFYQLSLFPISFFPDEMIYLIESRTMAVLGKPLTPDWQPLKLESLGKMWAELPASVLSLGYLLTDDIFLGARLIPAIMGVTLPFLFSWLIYGMFKNKQLAILGLLVSSANPWLWQLSRMSFDPLLSIWFYIFGLAIFINLKGYIKLIALPFFFLGFFQYQGLKPLLLPIVILFTLFHLITNYHDGEKSFKQNVLAYFKKRAHQDRNSIVSIFLINISLVFLFIWYIFILLPNQLAVDRLDKLIWQDTAYLSKIAGEVDTERRVAINNVVSEVFSNKVTIHFKKIIKVYLNILNPERLFLNGEPEYSLFAAFSHGFFYLIDFPLILLGLSVLYSKRKFRYTLWLTIGVFIISPVSSVINTSSEWMIFRPSFLYLYLLILVVLGLNSLLRRKKIVGVCFLVIYVFSLFDFVYHYYYRYPFYSANGVRFQERVLANYIYRVGENRKVTVFHPDSKQFLRYYYLYALTPNNDNLLKMRELLASPNKELVFQNLTIKSGCINPNEFSLDNQTVILDVSIEECELDDESKDIIPLSTRSVEQDITWFDTFPPISIASLIDSGEQYLLYGDVVCKDYSLDTHLKINNLLPTHLENLEVMNFCQTWITDLSSLRWVEVK